MRKIGKKIAIALLLVLPTTCMAYDWTACNYVALDGDSGYISGLQCGSDNHGTLSFVMDSGSGVLLGAVSEKGALGNCTYSAWDVGAKTIDELDCPSFVPQSSSGSTVTVTLSGSTATTPEQWSAYLQPRAFSIVGFVLAVLFFWFVVVGTLVFGWRYGFYFFTSKKTDGKPKGKN